MIGVAWQLQRVGIILKVESLEMSNHLLFVAGTSVFALMLALALATSNALAFGFGSGSGNTTQSMTTYKDAQGRFTILQPF